MRRGGPAPPPTNRREAKALRAKQALQHKQASQSNASGHEATCSVAHGKVRRLVCDIIDSRCNPCFLLPRRALLLVVAEPHGHRLCFELATN